MHRLFALLEFPSFGLDFLASSGFASLRVSCFWMRSRRGAAAARKSKAPTFGKALFVMILVLDWPLNL